MTWRVLDCPEHECCALEFPSGVLCLACGREILDTIDGLAASPAPTRLLEEARAAWTDNQGVRDFTAGALEKHPRTEARDGLEG